MSIFSERLKQLRCQEKISQKDLGDALGVSQQLIWKWEFGISTPNLEMLAKIATTMKVSADYLIGLSDNK